MTNTKQWVALLNQQYASVLDNKTELGLLLATRRFVNFLNTNPQSQRYLKEIERNWEIIYKRWLSNCQEIRKELSELEKRLRAIGAQIQEFIDSGQEIPNPVDFGNSKHILEIIKKTNWYEDWANLTDDLDLDELLIGSPSSQTLRMVSHFLNLTHALERLTEALGVERQSAEELYGQAEMLLFRKYKAIERKVKNDWLSSGKYALDQLRTVVRIIDGDIFIDPTNLKSPKIRSLEPWLILMAGYAPSDDLKKDVLFHLKLLGKKKSYEDVEILIKSHMHQIFTELQFLANSRLAHQHLVERYKIRCENYDWESITNMIKDYRRQVDEAAEAANKDKRYQFEKLLTLDFARYLYDNGYTVHHTIRDGVHEPDLLNLSNELEPVVVEAKVVDQTKSEKENTDWIKQGFRALWAYLEKYHSDYGVTDGYLVVFRTGGEKVKMYTFDQPEWVIDQFTIIPRIINLSQINKKDSPIIIKKEDFLPNP